eukprot:CAMPEP_0176357884 /NCGR_PEP_ID=MMETSP0126-20121128/15116_1 /TAXON_ID=141414 ORGANISM="Strombidinopsis acuminatum, Strain SPMC142" /NCGR_SAMPLE_ID=MMETSP0126 /ASSEMBLY_ACC=CAM_ASM_000229 /LENGTH=67 /DNA_ID=CAMNT_0017711731 /DNA_START=50 /DNA_END=256 /DNA_ORIENTATION=-
MAMSFNYSKMVQSYLISKKGLFDILLDSIMRDVDPLNNNEFEVHEVKTFVCGMSKLFLRKDSVIDNS